MEYMSAKEAAEKWGISQRRVAVLCSEKRIKDATMIGNMWIIPSKADKPADARQLRYSRVDGKEVKPFLKWAGGKGQLISEIEKYYPFDNGKITRYVEPFVGGGAVLFDILNKYELEDIYINDINAELINTYRVIGSYVDDLIEYLYKLQNDFIPLDTEHRKVFFLNKRNRFNELIINEDVNFNLEKAALMIFLNKTCFNGLYRVNKKGLFNVPMGSYKKPIICDENNLRTVSLKLNNVKITCGDYKELANIIDKNTFAYFDPPYRPLNKTSSFTAYSGTTFDDKNQTELAEFISSMNSKKAKIVISNSDPKNTDKDDNFFDNLYQSFSIKRIDATRMINSNSSGRGKIKELIISNF